jgi:hypothetical protein
MITLPLHNANRTMHLLNKTCLKGVPPLYAQDGLGDDAVVHLKFFLQDWTWFATEFDPETGEAFGKVFSSGCPEGELGPFNVLELAKLTGVFGQAVERDRYFTPCKLGELKNPCGA